MICAATYAQPDLVIPARPEPPPATKKQAPDAGGEEASPGTTSYLGLWLDDIGRTIRARYTNLGLWARIAGLAAASLVLGLIPLLGQLFLIPALALVFCLAGVAALENADGRRPTFDEVLPHAVDAVTPVLATGAWLVLSFFAWFFLPGATMMLARSLGVPVSRFLEMVVVVTTFVGGGMHFFTSSIYAISAALVDGLMGPAATAASRRCWGQNRIRTLAGLGAAKMVMNCEAMVMMMVVGVGFVPFAVALHVVAPGGPETLPTAGPLANVIAYGGLSTMALAVVVGMGMAMLTFSVHKILVYRSFTQGD